MSDDSEGRALDRLAYDAFGESAKYIGKEAFLPMTKAAVDCAKRVLTSAKKRKAELGIEGGCVSPRVLPSLLRSASVCEDDLVTSYLGGIMCSAHAPVSRDDRAVTVLKLIDGLSTYALRAHCIVYGSLVRQTNHKLSDVRKWLGTSGVTLMLNEAELQAKMQFQPGEDPDVILEHAFVNLSANELCMQGIRSVLLHKTQERVRVLHPTLRGIELFCWGTGLGQLGLDSYFSNSLPKAEVEVLALIPRELQLGIVSYG